MYVLPSGYNVSYADDKRYGITGYSVSSDVEKIQTEIMTGGPVEGAFTVYGDFPSYKSGKCFNPTFNLLILPTRYLTFLITSGQRMKRHFRLTIFFVFICLGVYQHTSGLPLGGHAIKILGWGTEDGKPYW